MLPNSALVLMDTTASYRPDPQLVYIGIASLILVAQQL